MISGARQEGRSVVDSGTVRREGGDPLEGRVSAGNRLISAVRLTLISTPTMIRTRSLEDQIKVSNMHIRPFQVEGIHDDCGEDLSSLGSDLYFESSDSLATHS